MIKILVVDDEPLALEIFSELIDWPSHGYMICGQAGNGESALRMIGEDEPDIVFTDIRMPRMDGLELAQRIHNEYPRIHTVILTAYRDFEYAQQAVSFGVSCFLLKNQITSERVLEILGSLAAEVRREQEDQREHQKMVLQNVVLGNPFFKAKERSKRECCLLLMQVRHSILYDLMGIGSDVHYIPDASRIEQLLQSEEELEFSQLLWVDERTWVVVILSKHSQGFSVHQHGDAVRRYALALRNYLGQDMARELFFAYDIQRMEPEVIQKGIQDMQRFTKFSIFLENVENCPYRQLQDRIFETDTDHALIREKTQEIRTALQFAQTERIDGALGELEEIWNAGRPDYGKFVYCVRKLIELLDTLRYEMNMTDIKRYIEDDSAYTSVIFKADQLWKWIRENVFQIAGLKQMLKSGGLNRYIMQAITYIRGHDREKLTVKKVAAQIGLSEIYFSTLFKQEMGMTFGDYLTNYRINIAKYLLTTGDYKIYEVAELTGYSTAQYFSQVFIKETGCTPADFKNKNGH